MEAPGTASPFSSKILPVMVASVPCAKALILRNVAKNKKKALFKSLFFDKLRENVCMIKMILMNNFTKLPSLF